MEINSKRLWISLQNLKYLKPKDRFLEHCLQEYSEKEVITICNYLSQKLLEFDYTEEIGTCFKDMLMLFVTSTFRNEEAFQDIEIYKRKCIALSKLMKISPEILRFSTKYFTNKPPPFYTPAEDVSPEKQSKNALKTISDIEIIKCCYNLLKCDPVFFKDLWDWSLFIDKYLNKGHPLQKFYTNNIVAILSNMTQCQMKQLNNDIPENVLLKFDEEINKKIDISNQTYDYSDIKDENITINWKLSSGTVTSIEGVLTPIYNKENAEYFKKEKIQLEEIVKVDSTKINLRNIALGISAGKAICLSGPVGCGKTTLIEYLARKTGRIVPKEMQSKDEVLINESFDNNNPTNGEKAKGKCKRKFDNEESDLLLNFQNKDSYKKNGFLRIQLGDQIDSKMLLGQYRCTDVPGEFIWLPGVLTQAVMNGYWLLLEDLDCATQDTFSVLGNLLENNVLSVPGFRDCVKIEPGFQLFATVRTHKSSIYSQKNTFSLLEKYLCTINILPLSRKELCEVIGINYPKLKTVASRIVDVFLTFSSGDHSTSELDTKVDYTVLPHEKVSISSLPNSGRLISTRDLMKLCHRSNPMFSVTSTECAYFVFQNAVDVFCSFIPQSKEQTKLITSIGAKLGIIDFRCRHFAEEYKPEIQLNDDSIKIGRSDLSRSGLTPVDAKNELPYSSKRIKLGKVSEKSIQYGQKKENVTFSFTRITSCLLERIAVCVSQNEPILLVGETGVGKTSSVQYLARQTNHKLIVINMNNQSDASDLVGGFKPVDLCYVMAPLRCLFESLFRKTFNEGKNEKFISNISICYNQGNFSILIKLMIKIVDIVFERARKNDLKVKNCHEVLNEWRSLQVKLLKLNTQLRKSINISFAFIPGSLVNCIKNGHWVLLDEINLASAETLECLSTILEPDGSIVLLEKGDLTPIKRHPDFRIFACMNPNTDIGKKDLPVGIRNRFTEFFVDELTSQKDLVLLVSDYLKNTGIQKTKSLNIVNLYGKLKSLSQLDLNDGLGNRPVFSLRTLCRALTICAKNLCGSIDRNIYESFCLSFLTQLDPISHKIVLGLIQKTFFVDIKAILLQSIPKPGENFINFEGYWIETGPKEILPCESYILTNSVRENLKDLARIISIGKLPILLQGPTSAGKTSLIEYISKSSGNHCLRINNHEHTDLQEYIGAYTSDVSGKLTFKEGVLVQAMRNGFWIILDELNLASTDILEALNRVLDDNRELFIPETQTVVKAHPNFMLFATQNPPGLYGGRKILSRAFKNRFIELHFSEIPKSELEIILEKRCLIPNSYAKKMVKCMSELKVNRKTTTRNNFTLRDLFRWGNRYTYANKELLNNTLYDWNQHLVDEGYLVLSARVRTDIENEIIEEALFNNFRKKISTKDLFSLHEKTSMVTRSILEAISNYKGRNDIIWTENMTRMLVLTAKALQFDEPVLLVGPTGCGKTTICQILSDINDTNLRILNCHMHTEGADFLGGLRPYRKSPEENIQSRKKQLFEWADGPLILSMLEGSYFMADEISLAEDSVLERLNCILEPERTVLLAEKGGINSEAMAKMSEEFIICAKNGFQFLATMNPGGDFGKKELSPALRNRFTEIWCTPSDAYDDLVHITGNVLRLKLKDKSEEEIQSIASCIIKIIFHLKTKIDKFKFSVRDILALANYFVENIKKSNLKTEEIIIFGLETIFLDALEMVPYESPEHISLVRSNVLKYAISLLNSMLKINTSANEIFTKRGNKVVRRDGLFGVEPFFIKTKTQTSHPPSKESFLFEAPTTIKNLFRILSALTLRKAILLEGPPGVGKTSTIENLAQAIGYKIVRINLCEHTDLADLFGTDLPAEEEALKIRDDKNLETDNVGSFVWRDGPLLAALKSENTWILLDELNLAPQSVLEGLNAVLDHRGEVFIPELNKTFFLGKQTRIFACQNPLKQGGGRKGLPQSFLNRFTKVFLKKLNIEDLIFVVNGKYTDFFDRLKFYFEKFFINIKLSEKFNLFDLKTAGKILQISDDEQNPNLIVDLSLRMVKFSETLDKGVSDLEFGYKGGPFEINLRDILRWCDLLSNENTGLILQHHPIVKDRILIDLNKSYDDFLLVLYERMKLVYYQRMRSEADKIFIKNTFSKIFNCDAEKLNYLSEDIGFYWTDSAIYMNDIVLKRDVHDQIYSQFLKPAISSPLILSSQKELLKNLVECVYMEKPVILCGATDTGKTKAIDLLCTLSNQVCVTDIIDDSVTGNFQQIDLNRHLEEISQEVEAALTSIVQKNLLNIKNREKTKEKLMVVKLLKSWKRYTNVYAQSGEITNSTAMLDELILFKQRIKMLNEVIEIISTIEKTYTLTESMRNVKTILYALEKVVKTADSLNTGGYFEWVDSKIVKALKKGQYICLEHINLCSSAVLDRLNSVFEPNGKLLISEKGVTANDEAEIVEKHSNFRAFLTIDPKNGELSRAMRNRCFEISLNNDEYSEDDLKVLICKNGIKEIPLINALVKIHKQMGTVTELSNFNVSHLLRFAFLVSSYQRIGMNNEKAVYNSGVEVYVNFSTTDYLGYGLDYYHNRLKEILKKEITAIELNTTYVTSLDNLILTCESLNSLSLIKMQCEPLKATLRTPLNFNLSEALRDLIVHFDSVEAQNSLDIIKILVYIMYESSSVEDLILRNQYINYLLNETTALDEIDINCLKNLNNVLFKDVADLTSRILKNKLKNLPWNSKLFTRIRNYTTLTKNSRSNELKLSSVLLFHTIIKYIPEQNIRKLNDITALAYSYAVFENKITDKIHHEFLNQLYPFVTNLICTLNTSLEEIETDLKGYIDLSTAFLWVNRLHISSNEKIFKEKVLNAGLVDKLLLHFKWTDKNLLKILENIVPNYAQFINGFEIYLDKIRNYDLNMKHPLNLIRKTYTKKLTNFVPLYSEEQIKIYEFQKHIEYILRLVPIFGLFENDLIDKKLNIILSDEIKQNSIVTAIANNKIQELWKYIEEVNIKLIEVEESKVPDNVRNALRSFLQDSSNYFEIIVEFNEEKNKDLLEKLENLYSTNEEQEKRELTDQNKEILPLYEYFATEGLILNRSKGINLNKEYYADIRTLLPNIQAFINIVTSDRYNKFNQLWSEVQYSISDSGSIRNFEQTYKLLSIEFYKNSSTFRRLLTTIFYSYYLSSLSNRRDVCQNLLTNKAIAAEISYNGPSLTNIILPLLCQNDGQLRSISLHKLNSWKNSLNEIRQLLWNNSDIMIERINKSNDILQEQLLTAKILTTEIEYIQSLCQNIENQKFSEYNQHFEKLIDKLRIEIESERIANLTNKTNHASQTIQNLEYQSFVIITLIGSIELCLLTSTPLIDPVEKNLLKKGYIQEDIQCLKTISTGYDFMKIIMNYKNFGNEISSELQNKIHDLESRKQKFSQKVPLRPTDGMYSRLIQDINHFLTTNCDPQSMHALILSAQESWIALTESVQISSKDVDFISIKSGEIIKRIELWISNAQKFLYHTLDKYSIYYKDFVSPLECSIIRMRFGLEGVKNILEQVRSSWYELNSGFSININDNGKLYKVLENIAQYPTVFELNVFDRVSYKNILKATSSVFTILEKVDGSQFMYFRLLRSKLLEIRNRMTILKDMEGNAFYELEAVLNICNQIWQEEEEKRRKRLIQEESLYVNKTRCESKSEDEIELLEIHEHFPTYMKEDFAEFITEDTLEQVIKISKDSDANSKNINDVICQEDYQFLGENFIYIMEHFAQLYYYNPIQNSTKLPVRSINFVKPLKERIGVFVKLFYKFRPCLNEQIDETLYNTFSFMVGLQQELLEEINISDNENKSYNYYKDSNIPTIMPCTTVLDNIEVRLDPLLQLYPDHAVLNDIIRVITKIRSLPFTAPIVRFNTGFQILRQKISQWNEVAHKNNHLRDLEAEVAKHIQQWIRLELQFWRNCLSQIYEKVENKAYKYWFFIYNLLHEYLDGIDTDTSCTDFKNVEKIFEQDEIKEESKSADIGKLQINDVTNVLRQFIESSNYADFKIRMNLLRAFELYLHYTNSENDARKDKIIATLHNLQIYFNQFQQEIEDSIKSMRTPIEKKLRELVKIESYNKDLSYISMRNNIARVHKNLNKFLKEFETLIRNKISPIFQKKENQSQEYCLDNDKGINLRYETKMKYYMIDVKNFIASETLKDKYILNDKELNFGLLKKTSNLFMTSRNIVKQAILHTEFPSMIYNLDSLLLDKIETCVYLRNLEVDRSQEKPKQKVQAKSILQQKRKALSDLYKTLSNLGLNYRTGLMELSTNSDLTDLQIQPFNIKNLYKVSKYKKLDQNLNNLNENLDTYYAKCIFKLKLLQNIMLSPNSELGQPNTDRIKGFSVDMFMLIQNQRKTLSKSMKELHDLRYVINDIMNLLICAQDCDFDNGKLNFMKLITSRDNIREKMAKIQFLFEQFLLLLKCIPAKKDQPSVLIEANENFLQTSDPAFSYILAQCNSILTKTKKTLAEIFKLMDCEFVSPSKVDNLNKSYENIKSDIIDLKTKLYKSFSCLPLAKPLDDLVAYLETEQDSHGNDSEMNEEILEGDETLQINNIENELENIIHSILLSIQKLYKKYAQNDSITGDCETENDETTSSKKQQNSEEHTIFDNHLKGCIHQQLEFDLDVLNVSSILKKITNILLTIKYTDNLSNKSGYVRKVASILPILDQFNLVGDYYLFQQLGAHKVSTKMLSIMLTVFIELGTKGFCLPADLMQDEDGESKQSEEKNSGGFGLEDGVGENDISDKIESEDQLDDAKKPEDRKDGEQKNDEQCKEEKGIEMSENFDSEMQDVDKPEDDDSEISKEDEEELDKEMGETEEGAEKLDDQIWGSDEEQEQSENDEEIGEEDQGEGSKDDNDQHNDLNSKSDNTEATGDEQNGLDATQDDNQEQQKKKEEKSIDNMQEPEVDEEQINPYHNELEEPPEAEEMDLGDNCDIDEENLNDDDQGNENPFDIDAMKENMQITESCEENEEEEKDKGENMDNQPDSDSEPEPEAGAKPMDNQDEEKLDEENLSENEEKGRGDVETTKEDEEENIETPEKTEPQEENDKDYQQSKDNTSHEDNVQSVQEEKNKGSNDEVQNENNKDVVQNETMDAQDTGEEKEGVGQAENDTSDVGHQGIANTKKTESSDKQKPNQEEKRKQGKTNEERTLGQDDKNNLKQLKTVDKLQDNDTTNDEKENEEKEASEFQHVKEPKKTDTTTLDSATEEQSKSVQHLEDENKNDDAEEENNDELMEVDETDETKFENVDNIQSEKIEQKSDKPSKMEKSKEKCETVETMEIEGDIVETSTVLRGDETTSHWNKDILLDKKISQDISAAETLELRKMFQDQITTPKSIVPGQDEYSTWQTISNKMLPSARELCEQLRLILEPTKCTRLKGDYRTGRRINMKKIIPYIASQFRKDKIWLRRTKPAQRDYKITIAIDDSKSMDHNNSKTLTLQAISLVSQALTLLESGKLSIVSFGETPQIILNHTEQFDGPKLVKTLNFAQNQTKIADLLDFIRIANAEEGSSSSDNGLFENLLLIMGDGRNLFGEGEQKVKNAIKLARLQRIFLLYIIIDNPDHKYSILDVKVPQYSLDGKSLAFNSYLDIFPFPYYVIVRDLQQLPLVLSESMRQWFELVNSEQ